MKEVEQTIMNDNLLNLLEYILKHSPIEKQDLLKDAATEINVSERTVRRNLGLLQKKGYIKSTELEYNAGELLEISESFRKLTVQTPEEPERSEQ